MRLKLHIFGVRDRFVRICKDDSFARDTTLEQCVQQRLVRQVLFNDYLILRRCARARPRPRLHALWDNSQH